MFRFAFSLVAAALIAVSGYAALGTAAHTAPVPGLKVIATVTAHAHRHSAVSAVHPSAMEPTVQ